MHLGSDVDVLVVVSDPHLGHVGRRALGGWTTLGEVGRTRPGLPCLLIEQTIHRGRDVDAKGLGHLVGQVVWWDVLCLALHGGGQDACKRQHPEVRKVKAVGSQRKMRWLFNQFW